MSWARPRSPGEGFSGEKPFTLHVAGVMFKSFTEITKGGLFFY